VLGVLCAAPLVTTDAHAGVSNPDYYIIDITNDDIQEINAGRMPNIAGTIEGDIESDGDFVYNASSFTPANTSLSGVQANIIVGASGTSGYLDPGSSHEVTLTLRMRIKFSGNAGFGTLPGTCQTAFFTASASTLKSSTVYAEVPFDNSTGDFAAVAEDFNVPAVTSGDCGPSNDTALNNAFALGSGPFHFAILLEGTINTPQIPTP